LGFPRRGIKLAIVSNISVHYSVVLMQTFNGIKKSLRNEHKTMITYHNVLRKEGLLTLPFFEKRYKERKYKSWSERK
jgi:hypothetical protein